MIASHLHHIYLSFFHFSLIYFFHYTAISFLLLLDGIVSECMKNANKLVKDRRKGSTASVPPKTAPQASPKKTGEHGFDFIFNIRNSNVFV